MYVESQSIVDQVLGAGTVLRHHITTTPSVVTALKLHMVGCARIEGRGDYYDGAGTISNIGKEQRHWFNKTSIKLALPLFPL